LEWRREKLKDCIPPSNSIRKGDAKREGATYEFSRKRTGGEKGGRIESKNGRSFVRKEFLKRTDSRT